MRLLLPICGLALACSGGTGRGARPATDAASPQDALGADRPLPLSPPPDAAPGATEVGAAGPQRPEAAAPADAPPPDAPPAGDAPGVGAPPDAAAAGDTAAGAPPPAVACAPDGAVASGPLEVLLVVDRSSSMRDRVGGPATTDRWTEVVAGLERLLARDGTAVSWGLKLFPVPGICRVQEGAEIPIAPMTAGAISRYLASAPPQPTNDGSPTAEVVRKAAVYLRTLTSPGPKAILLVTDGEPNCLPGAPNRPDVAGTVAAIREAAGFGLRTLVFGFAAPGSAADAALQQMGSAAGTSPAGAPAYHAIGGRDDLAAALDAALAELRAPRACGAR